MPTAGERGPIQAEMTKKNAKRIILLALIAAAAVAYMAFDLGDYFSLSYIKESRERFEAVYSEHTAAVISGYMAVYIVVTALSLPGAAVMTLLGGALFGLAVGTAAVSFASSIGATLACAVARFLLRDWVQSRLGDRLRKINDGMEREGPFYLFTLRLIPVFPFWMINLAMGLSGMRLITFYWVSQLGMLPGTVVYVNAGKHLGRLESPSGIFSWEIILSFALLGVFPLAAKKVLRYVRARRGVREIPSGGGHG
ncbi:MAG: hypothetical protein Kow0025_19020 [Thermodesulfovibrionales bacterium]